jgi:hypothetical protein
MALYFISYDLRSKEASYLPLHEEMAAYQALPVVNWTWAVEREGSSAKTLRDHFARFIRADDRILVTEVAGAWSTLNAKTDLNAWKLL